MGELDYKKEWSDWNWDIPNEYNIGYDVVDKHTTTDKKNKIALYWENAQGDTDKFTFLDMKNLTNKFGNVLKSFGYKKGDKYIIWLPNLPEFQISFLGGMKIGAIPIPTSIMSQSSEIIYRINDSGSKAMITTSRYTNEVDKIQEKCPTLKHIIIVDETYDTLRSYEELMKNSSQNLEIEPTKKDDIAFICYTYGKDEEPKGIVHLHRWVPGNDPNLLYWQHGKENDIIAHTGDLNWIFSLGNGFLFPWRWGISTFIYNGKFDAEHWFELIEKYEVTNLASVPTIYSQFIKIENAEINYDLSKLIHCTSAGEPLDPDVIKEWKSRFKLEIYGGIGKTEVMIYISNLYGKKIKPGSYGQPLPGKICAIVDNDGNIQPTRKTGILAIKKTDPGLFKEYWNKPKATIERFKGEWFLTGDYFSQDDDGYYWLEKKE